MCISEIYHVGINYFDEAIRHGSFEYEISKDTADQAEYAKQVGLDGVNLSSEAFASVCYTSTNDITPSPTFMQMANRYFNRGMFLIVSTNLSPAPKTTF